MLPASFDRHVRAQRAVAGVAVLGLVSWLVLFGSAGVAQASPTPVCVAGTCTVSFAETGAPAAWTVPAHTGRLTMVVAGGSGGNSPADQGGAGGDVTATLNVATGDSLSIVVGAAGSDGVPATPNVPAAGGYGGGGSAGSASDPSVDFPAGGGGGGSFVFDTAPVTVLAVAGGGGGSDGIGGSTAGVGGSGTDAPVGSPNPWDGGAATITTPGTGGDNFGGSGPGFPGTGPATSDTVLGVGGAGNTNPHGGDIATSGGGGGGYTGGGGGSTDGPGGINGGGGGGSGFLAAGATVVTTATNTGDGSVTISYTETFPTVTTLTVSPSGPITAGTVSTLTAAVVTNPVGTTPTGTVTFTDGVVILGTAPLVNGVATLAVTLPAGSHSLAVSYSGGGVFIASAAAGAIAFTVDPAIVLVPASALPDTGADPLPLTGLGLVLLAAGAGLLAAARRRSRGLYLP